MVLHFITSNLCKGLGWVWNVCHVANVSFAIANFRVCSQSSHILRTFALVSRQRASVLWLNDADRSAPGPAQHGSSPSHPSRGLSPGTGKDHAKKQSRAAALLSLLTHAASHKTLLMTHVPPETFWGRSLKIASPKQLLRNGEPYMNLTAQYLPYLFHVSSDF